MLVVQYASVNKCLSLSLRWLIILYKINWWNWFILTILRSYKLNKSFYILSPRVGCPFICFCCFRLFVPPKFICGLWLTWLCHWISVCMSRVHMVRLHPMSLTRATLKPLWPCVWAGVWVWVNVCVDVCFFFFFIGFMGGWMMLSCRLVYPHQQGYTFATYVCVFVVFVC